MTRVYEIRPDTDTEYARFDSLGNKPMKVIKYGPLPEDWRVPKLYIDEPRLPRPNFFVWGSSMSCIILDEKAMHYAGHLFEMSGQMFPFTYKDVITGKNEKYVLFKPTKCFDCLDEKKSLLDVVKRRFRYVFDPRRIQVDTPIITIPQLNSADLFALEGVMSLRWMELKYCIDKFNLTGLKLTEVWSDGVESWDDEDEEEEYDDIFKPWPETEEAPSEKNIKKTTKRAIKKSTSKKSAKRKKM